VAKGSCVLLVEDEAQTQSLLVRMLHKLGFEVEVAANGREAIDWIRRRPFAAVLMDCQMPVLDGFEATRRIRVFEEDAGRRTPIIAVTAGVLDDDRERCIAVGMDDYVSKPVRMADLGALLQRWAAGTREARQ
jgi:CheY-like chemotaxis protein